MYIDESRFQQIAGEELINRALATPEQVAADRAALTAQLNGQNPAVPAPATSSAGQLGMPSSPAGATPFNPMSELDATVFQGAESPRSYNFGALPNGAEPTPEGLQQETAFRTLFHQEGIPASIGNEIGRKWNQACANPLTPEQWERGRQEGALMLHKIWSGDGEYERNLAVAKSEFQRLAQANPKLPEMLHVSGLGNDPFVITSLVNLARAKGRAR